MGTLRHTHVGLPSDRAQCLTDLLCPLLCRVKYGVRPRPRHQRVCRVPSDSRFPSYPTHNFQQQDPLGCGWAVDNLHWERIFTVFGGELGSSGCHKLASPQYMELDISWDQRLLDSGVLVFRQGRVSVPGWESTSWSRLVQCRRN
eukprot:COSAG02_NODE_16372_length_1089_cov_0.675758_1_plen_144_part_10